MSVRNWYFKYAVAAVYRGDVPDISGSTRLAKLNLRNLLRLDAKHCQITHNCVAALLAKSDKGEQNGVIGEEDAGLDAFVECQAHVVAVASLIQQRVNLLFEQYDLTDVLLERIADPPRASRS